MKKTLIAAASLILLTPSIALAAWWNPFTWFPPKIAPQISATSSVATTSRPVLNSFVATTTPKIVQKKIIPAPTLSNLKPSTSNISVTQTPVVKTPITATPPNSTFCNGTYWTACPTGQNFVCPTSGNAYCQVPAPPVSANQNVCNGVTYSSCPSGTDFTCPSNRSGYCAVDPNYATQQQQQNTQQPTQSSQPTSLSQNGVPSCANGSLNYVSNCIKISPTTATGGATTTFTVTTGAYRFGSGSLNLATLALQCGSSNNCPGMYPPVNLSADGKSFTYSTYIPDNTVTYFTIGRTELVDSNNQYVNFSNTWLSVPVTNSNPNFGAPIPTSLSLSLDPASPSNIIVQSSYPPSGLAKVIDGVNVIVFDLLSNQSWSQIDNLPAHFTTTGSGIPTTAYLYAGSQQIASAAIQNGVAIFTNVNYKINQDVTQPFLIRIDANSITSTTTVSATVSSSDVMAEDSNGNSIQTTGSAVSNPITITP